MKHRTLPLVFVVPALGIAQIIGWGSLYYNLAVFAEPMRADLNLSDPVLYGAFTLSLLISGFAAPTIGKWIDAAHPRAVMSSGSILGATALAILGTATNAYTFVGGWIVAGFAMAACLYEASFATLNRIAGSALRQSVTALTLFGGLASTVFWPLSYYLLAEIGWRNALLLYAALNLFICLPIHWWMIVPRSDVPVAQKSSAPGPKPTGRSYRWLAAAFASGVFVFSVLSVYLIGMLKTAGLSAVEAVLVASCIGPLQVIGRAVEYFFARRVCAVAVGKATHVIFLVGTLLLSWLEGFPSLLLAFVFVVFYGSSLGLMTIVRGTVPAELYGREGYGELLGRLARPVFVAKALAPIAFSLVLTAGVDQRSAIILLVFCAAFALLAYCLAITNHPVSVKSDPVADSQLS